MVMMQTNLLGLIFTISNEVEIKLDQIVFAIFVFFKLTMLLFITSFQILQQLYQQSCSPKSNNFKG